MLYSVGRRLFLLLLQVLLCFLKEFIALCLGVPWWELLEVLFKAYFLSELICDLLVHLPYWLPAHEHFLDALSELFPLLGVYCWWMELVDCLVVLLHAVRLNLASFPQGKIP